MFEDMAHAEGAPFRISCTVRALSSTLRGEDEASGAPERASEPQKLWFKESSARNLRHRDFLSPTCVLGALYTHGQVPVCVLARALSVKGSGVLPVTRAEVTHEGLSLCVDRAPVFREVLRGVSRYLKPSGAGRGSVLINCSALHRALTVPPGGALTLGQLRTVLLADHQAALLRRQGFVVSLCPALPDGSQISSFLRLLHIDWPTVPVTSTTGKIEEDLWGAFQKSAYRETEDRWSDGADMARGKEGEGRGTVRINLKRVVREEQLQGYDPNLGICTLQEDKVSQIAHLEAAAASVDKTHSVTVLHVTSFQDQFCQQQVDVLWRVGGAPATQKHLICGPVKTPGSQLDASKYIQLRSAQMKEASEMKYGEKVEGQTWDELIRTMTSATVRFELLSTVHSSPVTLDVHKEGGVSTKGPRGGVFVMYNCARLHTLFSCYERAVEQGLYPELPDVSQLDFSSLKEEGEWLLLFNYIIPFTELLDQLGQSLEQGVGGARVCLRTEQVCRFLVSLSKDFSSYYNRVHVLGESMPHLFNQMFCRLQLLGALRELYHQALDTLHLPPVTQL